jgi:hypothetical protein
MRLKNVQVHIIPGGALAYELSHVSADPTGLSGVYCLQGGQEFSSSQMMFLDPRHGLPELHPLPFHMGSRGGGDGNPFLWDLIPGWLLLFPADAPRQVTVRSRLG